ncbi:molybdopterin-guanine dinucleotide biosynthesis protein B [Heyndrickxia sp. NPDC080065]|uniref:molybdopterin-guanine dinucleotide biosynthesis protein B n=1 Tax=Heyndrickxia sp. NPDC080065 TaxID=3390568 RepID=UPI003D0536A7
MERKAKVFQIVGFQNSGKTTIIQEIIQYWKQHNLDVGTIKHHGHGGTPDTNIREKDSDKHLAAGAVITSVEGEGKLLIQKKCRPWSLQEIIHIYELFLLDLILVEGYKYEAYPKAVIIRNEDDKILLEKLTNIQAVISWIPLKNSLEYPIFSIKNKKLFLEWLLTKLNK